VGLHTFRRGKFRTRPIPRSGQPRDEDASKKPVYVSLTTQNIRSAAHLTFLLDRVGSLAAASFHGGFRHTCHFRSTLTRHAETDARLGVIEKFNP
jgi:hypothetical protein